MGVAVAVGGTGVPVAVLVGVFVGGGGVGVAAGVRGVGVLGIVGRADAGNTELPNASGLPDESRHTESPLAPTLVVDGSRKITFKYDTPVGAVALSVNGPPKELVTSMFSLLELIVWIAGVPISAFELL